MTATSVLPTQRSDEPQGRQLDHIHRGGLLVVSPAEIPRVPHTMVWLPDRLYRLTFSTARRLWLLLVEDDLRWVAIAQVLVTPATAEVDMAATPEGTPLLRRSRSYVVCHESSGEAGASCRMTISAFCAH